MDISNRNLSLRELRTFCVAAELESFRKAGETLFVTASAVSHQIKALETKLGSRLFERQARSIVLTDAGCLLYTDVRPLLDELDVVTSRHRQANSRMLLRISVQPFFASELFIPALTEFTQRHPNIDIKVDTNDESGEKHPADADVSIRIFRNAPPSLASNRLFALKLVPAASADLCQRIQQDMRKSSTAAFPRIVHQSRPNAWRAWELDSGINMAPNAAVIRLDSMNAVARAAERGLGAALVPVQLSDAWFDSGALVRLFPHELVTPDAYYFVCRQEDANRDAVEELRQWALQKFDDSA